MYSINVPLQSNLVIPYIPTVSSVMNIGANIPNSILSGYVMPQSIPLYPSVISYPDVNTNSDLRREVTEFFYNKVINNWLKYSYIDLYQMFIIKGDKVEIIHAIDDMKTNTKSSADDNMKKYKYMVANIISKNDVYKLLEKFRKINNINWWDIKKYADKFKKFVEVKMVKYITNTILSKK
jgi:hypothetical protein